MLAGSLGSAAVCHSLAGADSSELPAVHSPVHICASVMHLWMQAGVPDHVLCLVGGSWLQA